LKPSPVSRRTFIRCAGSAAALAAAFKESAYAQSTNRGVPRKRKALRLGGPIFAQSEDPALLAEAHRALGYRAAYAPAVKLGDTERIRSIIKEFSQRDVLLAEVGAWVNLMDPDDSKRTKNLAYVKERLAIADELGALCCVDIAGSYNPNVWYGPDPRNISEEFIEATVENCRALIDAVKPKHTMFAIEMQPFSFPSGPDDYLKLIKAVDREAFAVHLDVCNVISSPTLMYNNGAVIRECFSKLGRWIVSCHAKDLKWRDSIQVSLAEVIPGRGSIDYRAYLTALSALPQDAPLMLEHLTKAEEYVEAAGYIRGVARSLDLSFESEV
jgi:sugar phosphate isomerase/epimerase